MTDENNSQVEPEELEVLRGLLEPEPVAEEPLLSEAKAEALAELTKVQGQVEEARAVLGTLDAEASYLSDVLAEGASKVGQDSLVVAGQLAAAYMARLVIPQRGVVPAEEVRRVALDAAAADAAYLAKKVLGAGD